MTYDIDIAKQVAKSLMQINAIILQPNKPFKWASGWLSPIYCDNRKILAYPNIRTYIRQSLAGVTKNYFKGANLISGVATAGIPHGVLVAEELGLPFIYVRAQAKSHGRKNQIEGVFEPDQSVVLIEDLISSGKSSIEAVKTMREYGLNVKGVIAIFSYNLSMITVYVIISFTLSSPHVNSTFACFFHVSSYIFFFFYIASKNFQDIDCEYISLCNYHTLLNQAVDSQYINSSDIELLEKWRKDPKKWKK